MRLIGLRALLAATYLPSCGGERARKPSSGTDRNALRFTLPRLNGEPGDLSKYKGSVVLGFPANDFGQEPRSNREIGEFCRANFGVSFPMFAKLKVTGEDAHPLFQALGEPDWNFNKYLLDRRGRLVERWGADTPPDDPALTRELDALLS